MENNEKIGFWKRPRVLLTFAIIFTVIWTVVFPVVFSTSMQSGMMLMDTPYWLRYPAMFFASLIPLSLIAAIVSIWVGYRHKKATFIYISNLIPIATLLTVILIGLLFSVLS